MREPEIGNWYAEQESQSSIDAGDPMATVATLIAHALVRLRDANANRGAVLPGGRPNLAEPGGT